MVEETGKTVRVAGLKVEVGPEVLQSFEEHKSNKEPGMWQGNNRLIRWFMRIVAKRSGYPGIFD